MTMIKKTLENVEATFEFEGNYDDGFNGDLIIKTNDIKMLNATGIFFSDYKEFKRELDYMVNENEFTEYEEDGFLENATQTELKVLALIIQEAKKVLQ